MNKTEETWERVLDPDVIRPSLFLATMFITTFEVLKNIVIGRVRTFYAEGLDENGPHIGSEYQLQVVSRNKSILYASFEWLLDHNVIDKRDIDVFEQLKHTRNQLAHKLFDVVTGQIESSHESQFSLLVGLLRKIEIWWVINFEIPTNPDYDGEEIDAEGIVPGSILSLQLLIEVASGNTIFLEQWRKMYAQGGTDV